MISISILMIITTGIIASIIIVSVQSSGSILISSQGTQNFRHFRQSIDTKRTTTGTRNTPFHHILTILYQQVPLHEFTTLQTESIPVDAVTTMFSFPKIPFHTINDQIQKFTTLQRQPPQTLPILPIGRRKQQPTPSIITIHIHSIVLVHGWMGNSKELLYLQSRLEQEAASILLPSGLDDNDDVESSSSSSSTTTTSSSTTTKSTSTSIHIPICIPYSSIINEGKTNDGIISGGQRLAYEVNLWMKQIREQIIIEHYHQHQQQQNLSNSINKDSNIKYSYKLSLSMIGNSLGGLYARYALKEIQFQYPTNTTASTNSNNDITIDPILYKAVFATTCTPHLGVGKEHLYIPNLVPSSIQTIIAKIIGPTGIDLFRIIPIFKQSKNNDSSSLLYNNSTNVVDIIQQMTFQNEFIVPLQNFHQRIAFSNTDHTDFQVPCSTAAFLISPSVSSRSSSTTSTTRLSKLHKTFEDPNYYQISKKWNVNAFTTTVDNNVKQQLPKSSIALVVESVKQSSIYQSNIPDIDSNGKGHNRDQIHSIATSNELAYQLNSIGWIKIFCDVRPYLPFISTNVIHIIVESIYNFIMYLYSLVFSIKNNPNNENSNNTITKIMSNTNFTIRENYSSKDIWDQYVAPKYNTNSKNGTAIHKYRWYVPFGHTVVIANSKNKLFSQFNQAGRPTMDHFAKIIVHEIIQTQL
jgi:hypothetical protein